MIKDVQLLVTLFGQGFTNVSFRKLNEGSQPMADLFWALRAIT